MGQKTSFCPCCGDAQLLNSKEKNKEEFFPTFNNFDNKKKKLFSLIKEDYKNYELIFEEKKKNHCLKIFLHLLDKDIIRVEYFVPVSSKKFINFMDNYELQIKIDKTIDNKIDKFQKIEKIDKLTSYYFLSYKKFFWVSPRYFIYIKNIYQTKEGWGDISFSTAHVKFSKEKGIKEKLNV